MGTKSWVVEHGLKVGPYCQLFESAALLQALLCEINSPGPVTQKVVCFGYVCQHARIFGVERKCGVRVRNRFFPLFVFSIKRSERRLDGGFFRVEQSVMLQRRDRFCPSHWNL